MTYALDCIFPVLGALLPAPYGPPIVSLWTTTCITHSQGYYNARQFEEAHTKFEARACACDSTTHLNERTILGHGESREVRVDETVCRKFAESFLRAPPSLSGAAGSGPIQVSKKRAQHSLFPSLLNHHPPVSTCNISTCHTGTHVHTNTHTNTIRAIVHRSIAHAPHWRARRVQRSITRKHTNIHTTKNHTTLNHTTPNTLHLTTHVQTQSRTYQANGILLSHSLAHICHFWWWIIYICASAWQAGQYGYLLKHSLRQRI